MLIKYKKSFGNYSKDWELRLKETSLVIYFILFIPVFIDIDSHTNINNNDVTSPKKSRKTGFKFGDNEELAGAKK